MSEVLFWLDLNMAELSGVEECWWLVPATLSLALTGGTQSYDLLSVLGTSAPADGFMFPLEAHLNDGNGNRTELQIVRRSEIESHSSPATTGSPEQIHIDRLATPTLKTYPTLAAGLTGYTIDLVIQTFSKTVSDTKNGEEATGLRATWQRWAIYQVASDVGDGTVRRLTAAEVREFTAKAELARTRLLKFENREHANHLQIISYRDY